MIELKFEKQGEWWDCDEAGVELCVGETNQFVDIPRGCEAIWVRLTRRPTCPDSLLVEVDVPGDRGTGELDLVDGVWTTFGCGATRVLRKFGKPCWATVYYE